jgi:hypothetical protein
MLRICSITLKQNKLAPNLLEIQNSRVAQTVFCFYLSKHNPASAGWNADLAD